MKKVLLVFSLSIVISHSYAQTTWAYVYTLLQKSGCTGSCHNGTGGSTLNLDEGGDIAKVYDNIVNVTPTNPAAKAKHNKLIYPGLPDMSFLLRKINFGFDDNLEIEAAEGDDMPQNGSPMSNRDIEIIRQWILYGAKETGNKVDTGLVSEYYNTYGISTKQAGKRISRPAAPNSTEGFQMHFGPVFLSPKTETELNIKMPVFQDQDIDVTQIDEFQNTNSHHFILYQFETATSANNTSSGIRTVDDFNDLSYGTMISAWAYTRSVVLPTGTAYKWDDTTYLDFNYHIPNYDADSIMAAEIYLNIYAKPQDPIRQQMYSTLINYGLGGTYPFLLTLPNLNQYDTLWDATYDNTSSDSLYIWLLSSHTHKYGKDYDIYRRNANGTRGTQLYEGYYNEEYTFNQGYYDWEHPAVRYFDPLEVVAAKDGLIHEAVFYNSGTQTVNYGLTTEDEMMLFFMQFTLSPIDTGSSGIISSSTYTKPTYSLSVSPNPASERVLISYTLDRNAQVKLEIYDVLGKTNKILMSKNQMRGNFTYPLDGQELSPGIYQIRLSVDNETVSKKLVYTKEN